MSQQVNVFADFLRWISDFVSSLSAKQAPGKVIQLPLRRAPWFEWVKAHLDETEQTGAPITDFGKLIFSHTDYHDPIKTGIMAAGCAATLCAALEESGFKSPHDASAISFKSYGTACELMPDCICVFEWKPGEHHVSLCDKILNEQVVRCLGGNQSHRVQDSDYPRAKLIATRWPVKV
jgi:hypothetical protein